LWLVFFYDLHLSILFCVQPWDKFRTLGCYLLSLNENMFDDGSGSLHFLKILLPKLTSQMFLKSMYNNTILP
jgi:hypothetical protein